MKKYLIKVLNKESSLNDYLSGCGKKCGNGVFLCFLTETQIKNIEIVYQDEFIIVSVEGVN